jgi:hypothetical protein
MGTCIDYSFRFGGPDATKVGTALEIIRQTQEARAEHNGGDCDFSFEPHDDGTFKVWGCYCKSGDKTPNDVCQKLAALTMGGGFRFWFYWECTDGFYESHIEEHYEGKCIAERSWGTAVVGLAAAVADAALAHHADADATIDLINLFVCAPTRQHDQEDEDEDDSSLENSLQLAMCIVDAFQLWPELIKNTSIRSTFGAFNRRLALLLGDAQEHLLADEGARFEIFRLQGLRSIVEAVLLKQATERGANGVSSQKGNRL